MARTTLQDRDTRETQMKAHVKEVANAILTDLSGDDLMASYLAITSCVHRYSLGNRMLQMWQAPDSRLVASRTAFSNMAKAQGHEGRSRKSKDGTKSWDEYIYTAKGCNAVWIWGSPRQLHKAIEVTDPVTGEVTKETRTFSRFFPIDTYCVEDIRYIDTDEPFVMPDFGAPVADLDLHTACLNFAASKGIEVRQEGLNGAVGCSYGGAIATQKGIPWEGEVPILLHELAHELLHDQKARAELTREVKEAEAEATCAVVLQYLGYAIGPQAAYLRQWKATPEVVLESMGRIAAVAGEIVAFIEGEATQASQTAPQAEEIAEPIQDSQVALAAA